jgi:hypothetical protein
MFLAIGGAWIGFVQLRAVQALASAAMPFRFHGQFLLETAEAGRKSARRKAESAIEGAR